ncbi:aromatic-ring-hydroxylating dioxygenase subunit beta [Novosphingobium sp.]|uniref:aromatic-ring-hydroxylating dioxygenase subunit beta n=1 Tax=Novosphingobium sp. TaxID=1874826 RepID=UPI003340DB89
MTILTRSLAEDLLYHEALLLDTGAWAEWVELYTPDATFHVPAWRDETTPTSDPDTELSLIFYRGRRNLEDRVWRATSGLSVASSPPARVVHLIANVMVEDAAAGLVTSAFTVHRYDKRAEVAHVFFGRYRHRFVDVDGTWRIAAKTAWLLNDTIPTVLDFYQI